MPREGAASWGRGGMGSADGHQGPVDYGTAGDWRLSIAEVPGGFSRGHCLFRWMTRCGCKDVQKRTQQKVFPSCSPTGCTGDNSLCCSFLFHFPCTFTFTFTFFLRSFFCVLGSPMVSRHGGSIFILENREKLLGRLCMF